MCCLFVCCRVVLLSCSVVSLCVVYSVLNVVFLLIYFINILSIARLNVDKGMILVYNVLTE